MKHLQLRVILPDAVCDRTAKVFMLSSDGWRRLMLDTDRLERPLQRLVRDTFTRGQRVEGAPV